MTAEVRDVKDADFFASLLSFAISRNLPQQPFDSLLPISALPLSLEQCFEPLSV